MSWSPRLAVFVTAGALLIGAAAWRWNIQRHPDKGGASEVKPVVARPRPAKPPTLRPPAVEFSRVAPQADRPAAAMPAAEDPPPVTPPPPSVQRTQAPVSPGQALPTPEPATPEDFAAASVDLDQLSLMFRDYRTRMGGNPEGTNAEIMAAVMGGNPKGARLGPPEGQSLNERGELVDRWGTAYFFHQMSGAHMEIHSAGPDKRFGTEDDVVLR